MKLKNKLLPLIGTAAIVATAAPLALTSCKSNTNVELIDVTDGTKAIPTIQPMDTAFMGEVEYTTAYVKACKANPEIFRQDFIYGVYKGHILDEDEDETFKYLKVGVSTPTFNVINVSYPGEPDVQYPTVSFTYSLQYSKDYEDIESSSYVDIATTKDLTVTFNNVPFRIVGNTEEIPSLLETQYRTNYWLRLANSYVMKYNMNAWSIDYSYTENKTETYITQSGKNVSEKTNSDAGTLKSYTDISDDTILPLEFGFESNYLSAVILAPEFEAKKVSAGENTDEGAIQGNTTDGITGIRVSDESNDVNGIMKGLYLPAKDKFGLYTANKISISVFADYDADGTTKLPIVLKQVVAEGSETQPVYLNIPTTAQAFYTSEPGDGWAAENTVYYEGSSYIPYQFPESKFYSDAECKTPKALMPTKTDAASREAFTFELPKYIWVQFSHPDLVDPTKDPIVWDQQVWLSQEYMTMYGYFVKK